MDKVSPIRQVLLVSADAEKSEKRYRRGRLREGWLAPIDTEGLYKTYPTSSDEIFDAYPRRFTKAGAIIRPENPDFDIAVQALDYVTMKGEKRAAVTGKATAGCASLYFMTWVSPKLAAATERDLASMLADMRLEAVAPDEQGTNLPALCARLRSP